MSRTAKKRLDRILVLCVDRDDDLGKKAGVETPVLGRKENIAAATKLALTDPEDPDSNAMFEAVRIFDGQTKGSKGREEYEVATIAGSDLGGVGADRQLVAELTEVLNKFTATDVILVTDGYTDEAVLPLVESRVPVTSVRRIVIKHSRSIEETAALFTRYFKILVDEPRYSRILMGVPGILLIILGVLWTYNWLSYAGIAFLIIVGALLLVKGFKIDTAATNLYKWLRGLIVSPPSYPVQIAGFAAVAGVLLFLVGGYVGGTAIAEQLPTIDPSQWLSWLPRLTGEFISKSIYLLVAGVCVILVGMIIRWFFERDARLWRTIVVVVVCAWSSTMFFQASQILIYPGFPYDQTRLMVAIITGIFLIVAVILAVYLLRRRYKRFFETEEQIIEDFEES
jgi:putative membrane protein